MKLPWVSRAAYTVLEDALQQARAQLRVEQEVAHAERKDLVAQLMDLRRKGFDPPPPAPQPVHQHDGLPPQVTAAILARMDPASRNGREAARLARVWIDGGDTPQQVADKILVGAEGES